MSRSKAVKRPTLTREGYFQRISYFVQRALTNIRQNLFVNLVTVATITLALLILSLFLLVYVNLEGAADKWSRRVQITTYFNDDLTPLEAAALKTRIESLRGTDQVTYVSRDEAMKRFRARLKGQETLLDGVSADVLPASLEITLKRSSRSTEAIEVYAEQLKKLPGVSEVQYGAEWVRRFTTFMNFLRLVGAVLGGFLVLAAMFIVSNTIKLTIYARKDELELLSLVGATRFFIKVPFLIEGILQGAAGALLALILLSASYLLFLQKGGNFLSFDTSALGLSFLSPIQIAGIFFGGTGLGFIGSLTSLKRFITV